MTTNSSILSEMDWDEGIAMPVANLENKQLEDEVSTGFSVPLLII